MKIVGILLIVLGLIGLICSTIGFGDIGLSFGLTGAVSVLCGIGFLAGAKNLRRLPK